MVLLGHIRILPLCEKLAGYVIALATRGEPFLVDGTIIERTNLEPKILDVERFSLKLMTGSRAGFLERTARTIDSAR
jgi:hypothetical protein